MNSPDLSASKAFLKKHFSNKKDVRALDVGSGYGRVAMGALAFHFTEVDLVDQSQAQIDAAKAHVRKKNTRFYRSAL